MGCRILVGREGGDTSTEQAVLFDSVTGWAFGPLFDDVGHADAFATALCFQNWLVTDARAIPSSDLEKKYEEWLDASGLRIQTGEDECSLCDGSGEQA